MLQEMNEKKRADQREINRKARRLSRKKRLNVDGDDDSVIDGADDDENDEGDEPAGEELEEPEADTVVRPANKSGPYIICRKAKIGNV